MLRFTYHLKHYVAISSVEYQKEVIHVQPYDKVMKAVARKATPGSESRVPVRRVGN
jgi:hypothetical protein